MWWTKINLKKDAIKGKKQTQCELTSLNGEKSYLLLLFYFVIINYPRYFATILMYFYQFFYYCYFLWSFVSLLLLLLSFLFLLLLLLILLSLLSLLLLSLSLLLLSSLYSNAVECVVWFLFYSCLTQIDWWCNIS